MVSFEFKHGKPLKVHRSIVERNPKLLLLDASRKEDDSWAPLSTSKKDTPSLKHISRSAGHVLIHYLYTNNYQTLTWDGPTEGKGKTILKLKTAVEVYVTALEYDMGDLGELAREQLTLLSKDIDGFTIIEIVRDAYPFTKANDTWFLTFIKEIIKTAFETPKATA
ncbi:hypothetical protein MFIFM68171_11317 [Madurella fahalii]|uniref:Uncharacterized protein n=1 Tax=Madurella fahalii TaxID=1157608 RepID=A0ABQ0GTR4_9PEZI